MSQIDESVRPFPSPDHTYAISPVKDEDDIKCEPQEEDCDTPTYRKKVFSRLSLFLSVKRFLQLRQRKSQKYTENDEDYFLMCQENLLNSLKRKHLKKRFKQEDYDEDGEDDEEDSKEIKEIEYRTIKWPKDALYFRYNHQKENFFIL